MSDIPSSTPNKSKVSRTRKSSKKRLRPTPKDLPARKIFKASETEMSENTEASKEPVSETTPEPEDPLQGLISRFGPGIGEILNSGHRSKRKQKVQQLLTDIQAMGDEMTQLQGVIELCDYFNMSMDELLAGFPIDQFVPALVELLNYEHNPDMMLLSTRALSYMIEAIPKASKSIVRSNAIPIFCSRLMFIQYIDVAEQTLQILGKLSVDHSSVILEAGGLMAVLTYLDFFGTSIQRSCVATAANLCRNVDSKNFELVSTVLPLLTNLLQHPDAKIVDSAILCFHRLAKSFQNNENHIRAIAGEGLVSNCLQLLTGVAPVGSVEKPGPILSILKIVCQKSANHIIELLEGGVGPILRNLLQNNEQGSTPTPNSAHMLDLLGFTDAIFPSLPPEKAPITMKREQYIIPQKLVDKELEPSPHEVLLMDNVALFESFAQCLYGPVKDTFSSNIDVVVRMQCLSIILKIVFFIPQEQLVPLLKNMGTSTFVASLVASNRYSYVATALRLANILLDKMSDIFVKYFTREGAVFGIDRLASPSYLEDIDSLDEHTRNIKLWISDQAQALKSKYFISEEAENDDESVKFATPELKKLQKLLKQLNKTEDTAQQRDILGDVAEMLVGGISIFEFLRSGAADLLYQFLTCGSSSELEQRWEIFGEQMEAGKYQRVPLHTLITLLQNSLTQSEKFVILLNDKKGYGSGIKYLAKAFKLRLKRSPDESELVDFSSNIVGIEPLASISAIEKFLWEKIQPTEEEHQEIIEEEDEVVIEDNSLDAQGVEEFADDSEYVLEVQPPMGLRASACSPIQKKSDSQKRLQFYYQDVPLASSDNIFRILQHHFNRNLDILRSDNSTLSVPADHLWDAEHCLTYKRTTIASASASEETLTDPTLLCHTQTKPMQYFMAHELSFDRPVPDELKIVLLFLKFLYGYMTIWTPNSEEVRAAREQKDLSNDLLANKITLKLSQQLQDTLLLCCGELPPWCSFITRCCPFLVPFDIRRQYFTSTQLGIARALHCLQQIHPPEDDAKRFKIGRIHRQKVRVSRSHILKCVFRVMELYGRSKAVLEVEFFGEAGTGLGPTLEFFTLVSHQLQRKDLNMWCYDKTYHIPTEDNTNNSNYDPDVVSENPLLAEGPFEYVSNSGGLFPRPLKETDPKASFVRKMFQLFGVVAGKALLDERMLDIYLSIPFFKWVVGEPLGLLDLQVIYPDIAKSLIEFSSLDKQYREELEAGKSNEELKKSILYRGAPIDDLCLTFVLPVLDSEWELKENGKNEIVTLENLREYINLVTDHLLYSGVKIQMEAFRRGFQSVLPISSLCCFSVKEIDAMLCGWTTNAQEYWNTHAILDAIVCDHQYTMNSLPVQFFASALSELSGEEKRNFLFFLTGSPRLPIGGFKSLHPRLTIVRKDTDGPPDSYLPSVMTCVNYVKLPAYSSPEVTRSQLKRAISEGLASFHLS